MRGDTVSQVPARGDRARVIHAGGDVVLAIVAGPGLRDELLQPRAVGRAISAVLDHTGDLGAGAWVLDVAAAVAGPGAVVALHETRVLDAIVGGRSADATVALLHDDGEDEAGVDASRCTDSLDCSPHTLVLRVLVVGDTELRTRVGQDIKVGIEPAREA